MPAVFPFAAVRYNLERVGGADAILEEADRWDPARREPEGAVPDAESVRPAFHVSRLYRDWAGTQVSQWLNQGVLVQDPGEALYVYQLTRPVPAEYRADPRVPESATFMGFLAAVDVGPQSPVKVCEQQDPERVAALASVVRAFAYDLAPVWGLFSASSSGARDAVSLLGSAAQSQPDAEFRLQDGSVHRLWRLSSDATARAAAALGPVPVSVVAGGERVAALRASASGAAAENGTSPRVLMLLTPADAEGMTPAVVPIHRLLLRSAGIGPEALEARMRLFFRLLEPPSPQEASAGATARPAAAQARAARANPPAAAVAERAEEAPPRTAPAAPTPVQAALAEIGRVHGEFNGFVVATAGGQLRLVRSKGRMQMESWTHPLGRAAWRAMDVNILHALLFERALGIPVRVSRLSQPPIAAEPDAERALSRVQRGEAVAAFLLPAPSAAQLYAVAQDNNPIPAAAVRPWPFPAAGILFRRRR